MLVDGGLPPEMVTVLPLGAPSAAAIWDAVGSDRGPRDRSRPLVVGFVGAGVWHKGAFTFASAAAQVTGDVRFVLHGSVSDADRARLAQVDPAGHVELAGAYAHADLPEILASHRHRGGAVRRLGGRAADRRRGPRRPPARDCEPHGRSRRGRP